MDFVTPIVVVNFKTFESAIGKNALKLAKIIEKCGKKTDKSVAICVTSLDLAKVTDAVKIPVFVEHCDAYEPDAHTGTNLLESARDWGAVGVLINHAEHKLGVSDIEFLINRSRKFGLMNIVCSNDVPVSRAIASLNPDVVAVEPPAFIGTDISVTDAEPKIVRDAVAAVFGEKLKERKAKVLCGAGIRTGKDVKKAIELGTDGVLVASGITKALNPEAAMLDMLGGL